VFHANLHGHNAAVAMLLPAAGSGTGGGRMTREKEPGARLLRPGVAIRRRFTIQFSGNPVLTLVLRSTAPGVTCVLGGVGTAVLLLAAAGTTFCGPVVQAAFRRRSGREAGQLGRAHVRQHHCPKNRASSTIVSGRQVQGCQGQRMGVPIRPSRGQPGIFQFIQMRMAWPTRWSSGTKPTCSKRLSSLSLRLSPMKK
jgi:hypothetical protein